MRLAEYAKSRNQEINGMNTIKVFPGYESWSMPHAHASLGIPRVVFAMIQPNQRRIRVWYSSGINLRKFQM